MCTPLCLLARQKPDNMALSARDIQRVCPCLTAPLPPPPPLAVSPCPPPTQGPDREPGWLPVLGSLVDCRGAIAHPHSEESNQITESVPTRACPQQSQSTCAQAAKSQSTSAGDHQLSLQSPALRLLPSAPASRTRFASPRLVSRPPWPCQRD